MRDSDLIEKIKKTDPEKLKKGLIDELNAQRNTIGYVGATWWNAYRSSLSSALKRAERGRT